MVISKKAAVIFAAIAVYWFVSISVFFNASAEFHKGFWYLGVFHPLLFLLTMGFIVFDYLWKGYWFNLTNFMLLLMYVYMGLGSMYYVTHFDSIPHETLKFPEFALESFWLVCLSALIFKLGSVFAQSGIVGKVRLFPRKSQNPEFGNRIRLGVLIAFAISIVIKFIKFKTGHFGFASEMADKTSSSTILNLFENLGYVAVMVSLYYWFCSSRHTRLDKVLCLSFIGILLFFALLYGMKAKVLQVILIIVIPALLIGRRDGRQVFSTKLYALVFTVFALYWAVNPLIRAVMVETRSSSIVAAAQNTVTSIGTGIEVFRSMSDEPQISSKSVNIYTASADKIWSRVSLFRYFNSVVAQTRPGQKSFRGWKRYPYLPISILPRAVIPNKPANDYSAQFNIDYISNVYNSTTPSALGWAYMESGIIGIIVLLSVLGFVYGMIDNYVFYQSKLSVYAVCIFGIFFIKLSNIEPDPYWLLSGIPHLLVLVIAAYGIVFMRPTLTGSKSG